jgi:hypothetical protein
VNDHHEEVTPQAEAAYTYINRDNWTILAVGPDKRPLGKWSSGERNRYDYRNALDVFARANQARAFGIIAGASGLIIIDLDSTEAIRLYAERFGVPHTRVANTPRGRHVYYLAPDDLTLGPSTKILPGIDVRAGESYAIIPPSETEAGAYTWANDLPIASLPANVRALLEEKAGETLPEPGERVTEGQRNDTLFNRVVRLYRAGLDDATIITCAKSIVAEYFDGVMTEVEILNTCRSGKTWVQKHPNEDPEDEPETGDLIQRLHRLDTRHLVEDAPPIIDWVWEDYLAPGTLNMLHGDGGLGKSYLSLKIAEQMSQLDGGELFGKKIHPGGVVILDGENAESQIHRRVHTTMIRSDSDLNVYILSEPILGYEEKTQELFEWIAEETNPRLVIVDSQRALWAGDEKEQMEVGRMLRRLAKGLEHLPYAVLLLHHDNRGKDYAGSSDTNAAISGARFHLEKHGTKHETQARRLSMPKNRIGPEMLPEEFTMSIDTMPRSHRQTISGITILPYESSEQQAARQLVDQAKMKIINAPCTNDEIWAAFGWEVKDYKPTRQEHRDIWRIILDELEAAGFAHRRAEGSGGKYKWEYLRTA